MSKSEFILTPFEVAKIYYELPPNRSFPKVIELLRKRFEDGKQPLPSQNQLSRMTREHEQNGFVKHFVLPDLPGQLPQYLPLLPELEDILRHQFGLRDAVVVDTSVLRQSRGKALADWTDKDDDLLHEFLGKWAGRILASLLRPEDILGTGGGRGTYYTARNCSMPSRNAVSKRAYSDIALASRVVSLTGFISAGMWRETTFPGSEAQPKEVDADHIASILHHNLGTGRSPLLLNCNISSRHAPVNDNNNSSSTTTIIPHVASGGCYQSFR